MAVIIINESEKIQESLMKEGKVHRMDSPEALEIIASINEHVKKVKRDYQVKDRKSQIEASKILLT